MADPTASLWEVTRLVLADPAASPQEIVEAHGFSMVEIAEILPLFLENIQADYARTATPGEVSVPAPEPHPGESVEDFAARYLTELRESTDLDLVAQDALGHQGADDWLDPGLDDLLDETPTDAPGTSITTGIPSANGSGSVTSENPLSEIPGFGAGGQPDTSMSPLGPAVPAVDEATHLDLTTDDPFGHEPPPDDSGHIDAHDGGAVDGDVIDGGDPSADDVPGDPTDFS